MHLLLAKLVQCQFCAGLHLFPWLCHARWQYINQQTAFCSGAQKCCHVKKQKGLRTKHFHFCRIRAAIRPPLQSGVADECLFVEATVTDKQTCTVLYLLIFLLLIALSFQNAEICTALLFIFELSVIDAEVLALDHGNMFVRQFLLHFDNAGTVGHFDYQS